MIMQSNDNPKQNNANSESSVIAYKGDLDMWNKGLGVEKT